MIVRLSLALLLFVATGAWAQVKLTNPGWNHGESAAYSESVGSASKTVETSLRLVGEGGSARWEYRSVSAELEALYRLDPLSLISLSSETLTKSPDASVRRTSEYRDLKLKAQPDEVVVTDFASLPVVLRGFPWGQRTSAKITTVGLGMGGSGFSFDLNVVGKEKVTAAGKVWECWHVTTGLGGAFSLLVPKSDWWFAVEGSHPLVKTSGPSGGPGSPMRTLVLQSYSGNR